MTHPRPLASLSPELLARKGAARPAMRPQGAAFAPTPDDLGWNDMGHPATAVPPVLVERAALADAIEAPVVARTVSPRTAARLRRETANAGPHAGKAALTLRLDADRHLRLRLAVAITNRSAQDLLVQALDALIDAVPAVNALVATLPTASSRKR